MTPSPRRTGSHTPTRHQLNSSKPWRSDAASNHHPPISHYRQVNVSRQSCLPRPSWLRVAWTLRARDLRRASSTTLKHHIVQMRLAVARWWEMHGSLFTIRSTTAIASCHVSLSAWRWRRIHPTLPVLEACPSLRNLRHRGSIVGLGGTLRNR